MHAIKALTHGKRTINRSYVLIMAKECNKVIVPSLAFTAGTVPIIRAVTRLLRWQEIDIESWAGPTFETFCVVTWLSYRQ